MTRVGSVDIRRAGPGDAATLHVLGRNLAIEMGRLADVAPVEVWQAWLAREEVVVFVATDGGSVVGYVAAVRRPELRSDRGVVEIVDAYVGPAARRRGIGSALVHAVAREHDGAALQAELEEGDLPAQRCAIGLGARLRRRVLARWEPTTDADG